MHSTLSNRREPASPPTLDDIVHDYEKAFSEIEAMLSDQDIDEADKRAILDILIARTDLFLARLRALRANPSPQSTPLREPEGSESTSGSLSSFPCDSGRSRAEASGRAGRNVPTAPAASFTSPDPTDPDDQVEHDGSGTGASPVVPDPDDLVEHEERFESDFECFRH